MGNVKLPETAQEAAQKWLAGETLAAVAFLPGLHTQQVQGWDAVFQLVDRFPWDPKRRWTTNLQQFDSWCFANSACWPGPSANVAECQRLEKIRVMAFAILREGFSNVVSRRAARGMPRIQIRKTAASGQMNVQQELKDALRERDQASATCLKLEVDLEAIKRSVSATKERT